MAAVLGGMGQGDDGGRTAPPHRFEQQQLFLLTFRISWEDCQGEEGHGTAIWRMSTKRVLNQSQHTQSVLPVKTELSRMANMALRHVINRKS